MKESKFYTSHIVEICENGDAIIDLPPELCDEMNWKEGTVLSISMENNCIILTEKKEKDASST